MSRVSPSAVSPERAYELGRGSGSREALLELAAALEAVALGLADDADRVSVPLVVNRLLAAAAGMRRDPEFEEVR